MAVCTCILETKQTQAKNRGKEMEQLLSALYTTKPVTIWTLCRLAHDMRWKWCMLFWFCPFTVCLAFGRSSALNYMVSQLLTLLGVFLKSMLQLVVLCACVWPLQPSTCIFGGQCTYILHHHLKLCVALILLECQALTSLSVTDFHFISPSQLHQTVKTANILHA